MSSSYDPPGGSQLRRHSSQHSHYHHSESNSMNPYFGQHSRSEELRDQDKHSNINIPGRWPNSTDALTRQVERSRRESNPRRPKSYSGSHGPVTSREEFFVGVLTKQLFILTIANMIDKSAAHYSNSTPLPTHSNPESVFFSVTKPDIPTKDYLTRLVRYTQCNNSAFVVMLIYLDRIGLANKRLLVTPFNMHRLLVTALTLACKMLDDRCFSNVHYAKVGGIPTVREMNRLELQFLKYLRYRLHVRKDEYECKVAFLESRASTEMLSDKSPTYIQESIYPQFSPSPQFSPVTPSPPHSGTYVRLPSGNHSQYQFRDTAYSQPMVRMESQPQLFQPTNVSQFGSSESTISRDTTGISGRRSTLSTGSSSDQHYSAYVNGTFSMIPDSSRRISAYTREGPVPFSQDSHPNDWNRYQRQGKRQGRPQGRGLG